MNYVLSARRIPQWSEPKKQPHPDAQGLQLAKCPHCGQKIQLVWRDPVKKTLLIFPEHHFLRTDKVHAKCDGSGQIPETNKR